MGIQGHAKALAFLVCALLGLDAARADTVQMINGLKIEGKVHLETPEFIILLVYNESGRVRIPRTQIKSIEYDFESKLDALKEDDIKGQYDLGVWALSKGMYKEAIQIFEQVKGKEGAGADLLKLQGQAFDKEGLLEKAYQNYIDYMQFHPEDVELKMRVDALHKELGLDQVKKTVEEQPKEIKEGLETTFKWADEKYKTYNPSTVQPYAAENGNKMFCITTAGGENDKAVVVGVGADTYNLSQHKEIIFKAYHNSKAAVKIALAFVNKNGEYFESKFLRVPPNAWAPLTLSLEGSYKSEKSNWEFSDKLRGRDDIKMIKFLVYEREPSTVDGKPLVMYIDHIFFR